jgi:uncharacterized HAD superfamily protein/adenine/guanine phosphoribosyltransferase-like PRPP-binding protein
MEKCICEKHGYCKYYNQKMTASPPNWQWCQNASAEERKRYKIDCDKKHERRKSYLAGEYITTAQLIRDCKNLLLPQLAGLKIKGVVGIPRSGMLPASMIAMWLNIPIYFLDPQNNLLPMSGATKFGGQRMLDYKGSNGSLLVVDDTVYAGTAMKNIGPRFLEDVYFAAVYVKPEAKEFVDFYAKELPPPHLLEWNLFNCTYIEGALLDFDGIFCPNVPHEACQDEEKYVDYIKNVKPFPHRIPKTRCKGIVTARLEKYRDITEWWLQKHGINYGFLKMYPTEDKAKRDKDHVEEASTFKANIFSRSNAKFFIESEVAEAVRIRKKSGKFVICPEEKDG